MAGQNADDHHDDQEFDQCKASAVHHDLPCCGYRENKSATLCRK